MQVTRCSIPIYDFYEIPLIGTGTYSWANRVLFRKSSFTPISHRKVPSFFFCFLLVLLVFLISHLGLRCIQSQFLCKVTDSGVILFCLYVDIHFSEPFVEDIFLSLPYILAPLSNTKWLKGCVFMLRSLILKIFILVP